MRVVRPKGLNSQAGAEPNGSPVRGGRHRGEVKHYKHLISRRTMRRAFTAFFNRVVRNHHRIEYPCDRIDNQTRDRSRISVLSGKRNPGVSHPA
jgi:hypothetical protein